MIESYGYAAQSAESPLGPFKFQRHAPDEHGVQIAIAYCGVCHSDLHTARNEWKGTRYPVVPGHEIVGHVTAVGSAVSRFKVGDVVGVGCMVESCQSCAEGLEQYCEKGFVGTYNGKSRKTGQITMGGYADNIVVDEAFVLRVSDHLNLAAVAPLLCAGITTYSPLRQWQVGPGHKVGIVGLGGLGHMGVKIAHAMGAQVVLFTTTPGKAEDAKRLGADQVVISKNPDEMAQHRNSFDFILNTVAASHALDPFLELLKRDGTMTMVGVPEVNHPSPQIGNLVFKRRRLAGSLIGGIAETQEMLDFCAAHGIVSDIELISIDTINDAYERMLKSDVKYRFVIDVGTLQQ